MNRGLVKVDRDGLSKPGSSSPTGFPMRASSSRMFPLGSAVAGGGATANGETGDGAFGKPINLWHWHDENWRSSIGIAEWQWTDFDCLPYVLLVATVSEGVPPSLVSLYKSCGPSFCPFHRHFFLFITFRLLPICVSYSAPPNKGYILLQTRQTSTSTSTSTSTP